jgi:cell division protein FtsB
VKPLVHTVFFGLACFFFVYTASIGIKSVFRYNSFKLDFQKNKARYEAVLARNAQLKLDVQKLCDNEYWEMQARQRFGYVKKGEIVYRFIER